VSSIDEARERGVTLLSSGPAGGILGARTLAQQLGVDRAIATDVGGTSFDVGLIVDGELSYAEAPVFAKYPVTVPVIDVTSIGAGGGSIAWIERETGILRVGPQSAGASPGPVCYGVGGDQPTVTDANLVLGRLNPDNFLGGRMKLDAGRARDAVADRIGVRLGMSPEAAAAAIIRIVDSQMTDLIRKVTVERGLDPASFTVLSYGGAGGLHVGTFAAKLRSRHVVIPLGAAVFSAIGIARSDVKRVAMTSDPMRAPFDLRQWQRRLEELESRLERELREERLPTERLVLRRFVDLQFRGQVHTVRVPLDPADLAADDGGERVIERFTGLYETKYGRGTAHRKAGVELMTFIVEATATLPVPRPEPQALESPDATAALRGSAAGKRACRPGCARGRRHNHPLAPRAAVAGGRAPEPSPGAWRRLMSVELGVALPLRAPLEQILKTARLAEELGCGFLWATDDRLQKDVFSVLAAIAMEARRLRLGPGVTNPYSRHPALIAAGVATLDELSGGRAVLGIGAGGTNHQALGIRREAPAVALREAIGLIRGLLAGDEVTVEGRIVHAIKARLDFVPIRAGIPIYVGSRGPQVLELAGELADGVIVGNVATSEGWRYALDHIAAGAERAGRTLSDLLLTAWVYLAVADKRSDALEAVRPLVATSLVTSRPVLHEIGIELPIQFAEAMEGMGWSLEGHAVERAGRLVPDETLAQLAVAGTPADCGTRLYELLDSIPLISQVVIVPAPSRGQDTADVVRRFMLEVVPRFAPRLAAEAR
jgi:5,10-methylenetetrahydromethanopterin reductase